MREIVRIRVYMYAGGLRIVGINDENTLAGDEERKIREKLAAAEEWVGNNSWLSFETVKQIAKDAVTYILHPLKLNFEEVTRPLSDEPAIGTEITVLSEEETD